MSLYIACGYIVPGYFVGDEVCLGAGGDERRRSRPARRKTATTMVARTETKAAAIDSQALALQAEALRIARIHADDDMILTLII